MTAVAPRKRVVADRWQPPEPLDRRFEAIVFDWDGTAVADRVADASALRALIEDLCAAGMHLAVITGTHVGNVDGQLRARPFGPGRLLFCVNRGSEVWPLTLTRLEQCCPAGSPTRLSGVRLGNGATRVFLELAHRLAHDHQKRCD